MVLRRFSVVLVLRRFSRGSQDILRRFSRGSQEVLRGSQKVT